MAQNFNLKQTGEEVQHILDTATPVTDLQQEAQARQQADQQLQDNIDTEAQTRQNAIDTLAAQITQTLTEYYNKLQVDDLIRDFITASVSNLVNYYKKTETFTKTEVQQLIAAVKQFRYQSVAVLPTASAETMNIIYLVPSDNPKTRNVKDEFITTSQTNEQGVTTYLWEQIGSTAIDLSGYPTTEQMNQAITAALNSALASYYTKTETNALLDTIRQSVTAETNARTDADATLRGLIQQVSTSLVNYYLKTETYSKSEVQQLVNAVQQFRYVVAASLPANPGSDTMGIIYLIPSTNPKAQNIKDEFITVLDGSAYKWEQIGSTTVDLSGYSTTEQMNAAIASALASYYTKTQVDSMVATINAAISQKQNAITDGAQIGLGFGVSSEAATVQARTATIANFILLKNMPVSIRFQNAINVDSATLNISSTGAKPILIEGAALQAGLVKGGCTVTVIFDGTNWNIVGIEGLERPVSQSDLFVDMGLPSGRLWAIANIDVTKQSGFAEVDGKPSPFIYECTFFSWGNTEGHNPISDSAFSYNWGENNDGPYAQTPGAQLTANAGLSFDAARAILGAPWRDPSTEDFAELFANIDYVQADGETVIDASQTNKLVTVNGIVGIYLKSKINGRLLFFPCPGYGRGQSWYSRGSVGYYWSRSLYSQADGRNLGFYSGGVSPQSHYGRFYGFSRRAAQ